MKIEKFWHRLLQWIEVMENTHDYRAELQRNTVQEIAELSERVKKLEAES